MCSNLQQPPHDLPVGCSAIYRNIAQSMEPTPFPVPKMSLCWKMWEGTAQGPHIVLCCGVCLVANPWWVSLPSFIAPWVLPSFLLNSIVFQDKQILCLQSQPLFYHLWLTPQTLPSSYLYLSLQTRFHGFLPKKAEKCDVTPLASLWCTLPSPFPSYNLLLVTNLRGFSFLLWHLPLNPVPPTNSIFWGPSHPISSSSLCLYRSSHSPMALLPTQYQQG